MKTLKTNLFLLFLSFSFSLIGAQDNNLRLETFLPNFPANGFLQVDDEGNLYASEYGVFTQTGGSGTRIFKIAPNGVVIDTINNLKGPIGSLKDKLGNLYINNANDTKSSDILKINSLGQREVFSKVQGWPIGMKMDSKNNIYLTNYNSPEIYKIDEKGKVSVFVSHKDFIGSAGIDFDSKGNLIIANFATASIFLISPDRKIKTIAKLSDIVVQGWGIGHLIVLEDNIYVTGIAINKIYKIDLNGDVKLFAGNGEPKGNDGLLLDASINYPNGITADKKNKIIYISEYGRGGGIRKIQL